MSKDMSKEDELMFLNKLLNNGAITKEEFEIRKKEIIYDISISSKSKTTAGLLALFFGGIGVHKFYLGNYVQGALCLIFWWTFIPLIISLIEACIYFSMSEDKFQNKVVLRYAQDKRGSEFLIIIPIFLLIVFIIIILT